jgi:hypothetical protein
METVLSSKVWNSTFSVIATLDECANEDCKKPIHKRMPPGKDKIDAQCFECKAEYTITSQDDDTVVWTPKLVPATCANPNCFQNISLWPHQVKAGTNWHCSGCGLHNVIRLGVAKMEDKSIAAKS